ARQPPQASADELTRMRALFRRCIEIRPSFVQAYVGYGATFVLDSGDPLSGIAALESARRLAPARADVAAMLAILYVRRGRSERAAPLIARARLAAARAPESRDKRELETLLGLLDGRAAPPASQ